MDYKEKYEALLANIKAYHARFGDTCNLKKELEECVPELSESEDERIRKNICRIVEEHMRHCAEAGIEIGDHREALQYLEKQKERERILAEREVTDIELDLHEIIAQAMSDKRLADEDMLEQFEREAALSLTWAAEKQFRRDGKLKEQQPVPALNRGDEIILKAICEELKDAPGWVERIEGWYSLAKDAQQPAGCSDCKEYDLGFERGREEGVTAGYNKAMKEMEQKEQKPVENTPIYVDAAKKYFDSWIEKHRDSPTKWGCFWEGILYSGKLQHAEWSDEDAVGLDRARDILRSCRGQVTGYESDDGISEHDDAIRTLERIRPARPHWRPSEEQMKALQNAVALAAGHEALVELYDDLKKL